MAENEGTEQGGDEGAQSQQAGQEQSATHELGDGGKKALEAERTARKETQRQLGLLQKELDRARQASMSEDDKKLDDARKAGHAEAVTSFGKRLARTEFDAAAGRRNPDFDTAAALEYVDLGRFVGDDGEPDLKAIKAAVERLVPTAAGGTPGFDGGARGTAGAGKDMNALLRQAAGRA